MKTVAYYNGTNLQEDSFVGYDDIFDGCGAYHYFSSNGGNIKCWARGTYNVYFKQNGYNGKSLSIELSGSLNAEHLAAKLMGFGEWADHCGDADRFPAMKSIFLGLSPSEQTAFQGYASSSTDQFRNAYERYVAWATALGEKPWESGKVSGSPMVFANGTESANFVPIIVIVSLVSVTAIGGLFFIKKRRVH